ASAPVPPPAPQTSEGFQGMPPGTCPGGPLPLAGFQGAAPGACPRALDPGGGVRGEAPVFLWFTRLPSGPGAYAVATTSSAGAPRGWAARPGWRRPAPSPLPPPPSPRPPPPRE